MSQAYQRDGVINRNVPMIALSEGTHRWNRRTDTGSKDLGSDYKYRHNNSITGR